LLQFLGFVALACGVSAAIFHAMQQSTAASCWQISGHYVFLLIISMQN